MHTWAQGSRHWRWGGGWHRGDPTSLHTCGRLRQRRWEEAPGTGSGGPLGVGLGIPSPLPLLWGVSDPHMAMAFRRREALSELYFLLLESGASTDMVPRLCGVHPPHVSCPQSPCTACPGWAPSLPGAHRGTARQPSRLGSGRGRREVSCCPAPRAGSGRGLQGRLGGGACSTPRGGRRAQLPLGVQDQTAPLLPGSTGLQLLRPGPAGKEGGVLGERGWGAVRGPLWAAVGGSELRDQGLTGCHGFEKLR